VKLDSSPSNALPGSKLNEADYTKFTQVCKKLQEEALYIINEALQTSDVRIHSVTSRIKTFKSFAEKAERKQVTDPYAEIQDVVGIRIVCLFLSDIPRIGKLLENAFEVIEQDDKIDGGEASSFGYMSFHFTVRMKDSYTGPRYKHIGDQPFEIQVRTIAMNAWAATSHYLDYKSEIDVPSELRRDFFALSGLFYVADRHFEMFFNSKKATIAGITETLERAKPNWDQELNLDSLTAYLASSFPERKQPSGSDVSQLLGDLSSSGITNIKDVKSMVDKNFKWFEGREMRKPPHREKNRKFASVGVVRIILQERYDPQTSS
jgi:putative GTP pyrophosphokinase